MHDQTVGWLAALRATWLWDTHTCAARNYTPLNRVQKKRTKKFKEQEKKKKEIVLDVNGCPHTHDDLLHPSVEAIPRVIHLFIRFYLSVMVRPPEGEQGTVVW